MKSIQGCGTALVTPFNKNLEIDFATFKKLVQRQIDSGVHFLVPLGTTGEAPCIDDDEKMKLLEITMTEAYGKIPVIVGATSNCTRCTIKNIKMLEKIGPDGFLVATPYYNKPTQHGLYNHFLEVSEATEKPIIIYNVPGRTGVNMTAETCLKVASCKNIVAVKEASSNYAQISEIIKNAPLHFTVLSGNDDETLSLCATGASGVISVASNIAPQKLSTFVELLLAEKFYQAKEMHHNLMPLFKNCFVESNPIPVKAGMYKMGLIENVLRPPLYAATTSTIDLMDKTIKSL